MAFCCVHCAVNIPLSLKQLLQIQPLHIFFKSYLLLNKTIKYYHHIIKLNFQEKLSQQKAPLKSPHYLTHNLNKGQILSMRKHPSFLFKQKSTSDHHCYWDVSIIMLEIFRYQICKFEICCWKCKILIQKLNAKIYLTSFYWNSLIINS